ncbi:MAG: acyl carrier protein [Clostridia bacterium]|nr:acyl carrier protein [Clostridia bacterium]
MEKLIGIIENYVEYDGEITRDLRFKGDLGLSSFDTVCMVEEMKNEFGKKVEPSDFIKYKTVGEMADFLEA